MTHGRAWQGIPRFDSLRTRKEGVEGITSSDFDIKRAGSAPCLDSASLCFTTIKWVLGKIKDYTSTNFSWRRQGSRFHTSLILAMARRLACLGRPHFVCPPFQFCRQFGPSPCNHLHPTASSCSYKPGVIPTHAGVCMILLSSKSWLKLPFLVAIHGFLFQKSLQPIGVLLGAQNLRCVFQAAGTMFGRGALLCWAPWWGKGKGHYIRQWTRQLHASKRVRDDKSSKQGSQ